MYFTEREIEVKTVNSVEIGRKLTELRVNWSQESVAEAVGISKSALSMYEQGIRLPRDEIKVRLAEFYGVSVEEIFLPVNFT